MDQLYKKDLYIYNFLIYDKGVVIAYLGKIIFLINGKVNLIFIWKFKRIEKLEMKCILKCEI